ncbi:MAG TPA: sporulation protein [Thermoplasmata archaeon]|nr:sporulation protein [Thermoplasmata archaeon]
MGILDKLKTATNVVSGGGAKVSIEYPTHTVFPGEPVQVRVTVMSSGGEVKSKGIYADLVCEEVVSTQEKVTCQRCRNSWDAPVNNTKNVANQSYPLAPAFVLAAGETRTFEGTLQVPGGSPPSFTGPSVRYEWKIRGRLEAFGNDPDSGFQSLRVGTR